MRVAQGPKYSLPTFDFYHRGNVRPLMTAYFVMEVLRIATKECGFDQCRLLIPCSWEHDLVLEREEESLLFFSEHTLVFCKIILEEVNLAIPHIFHQNKV